MRALGLSAIAVQLLASPARADEGSKPVIIRYEATADCPSAEAFAADVRRAAPTIREAEDGERALALDVKIEGDGPLRRGRLAFTAAGRTATREIDGSTCTEVSGLLAFASALAIVPDASRAPPEPASEAPPRPAPAEAPASARPDPPTATRSDLSLTLSSLLLSDNAGPGLAIAASVLYRRGLFVAGVIGDVGLAVPSWLGGGPAVGLSAPTPSWLRLELLGHGGVHSYVNTYTDESRHSLPFIGGRARASFALANVLVGLEGIAEKDFGDVRLVDPAAPDQRRAVTRPSSAARIGGGLFVGGSLDL